MAAHHEAYAALAEQMTAAWQALVEEIIRDGVTDGTLRCADIPRTARQISAMLNGYADLLTINPSEIKASEGMADLTNLLIMSCRNVALTHYKGFNNARF